MSALYFGFLIVLQFKAAPKLDAFAAGGISIPCILLAIAAIVVSTQINHRDQADTVQTWACKWKGVKAKNTAPQNLSNDDFETLCLESVRNLPDNLRIHPNHVQSFSYWGMIAVLCLQTGLFVSALVQWVVGKSNGSVMRNEKASEEYTPS